MLTAEPAVTSDSVVLRIPESKTYNMDYLANLKAIDRHTMSTT